MLRLSLITAICVLFITISFTLAQLAQNPNNIIALYGTIKWNGNPAPIGTIVKSEIGEPGNITVVQEGFYGNPIPGEPKLLVSNVPNGTVVHFLMKKPTMNGFVQANENATFPSGVRELNLTFNLFCGDNVCDSQSESCSSCSTDCGACASPPSTTGTGGGGSSGGGGGSGSGGGGSGLVTTPTTQSNQSQSPPVSPPSQPQQPEQPPAPPAEPQPPSVGEQVEPSPPAPAGFDITGFFTGLNTPTRYFSIIAIVIIILGLLIYWKASD